MRQKDVFLESEADAWFERNHAALARRDFNADPVCRAIARIVDERGDAEQPLRLLEVGCGEGLRLTWLESNLGIAVAGIDPSAKAVEAAQARGLAAKRGTADDLPFGNAEFDILVFGFCLYLCDPQDLFRIAQEADRVLRDEGGLVIHDFRANAPMRREYHHKQGLSSHKMDFRRMFDRHPPYVCDSHEIGGHGGTGSVDDPQEWVAVSMLREKARS